jgi:hypothetical protein
MVEFKRSGKRGPGALPLMEKREEYARLMRQGMNNSEACRVLGIGRKTGGHFRALVPGPCRVDGSLEMAARCPSTARPLIETRAPGVPGGHPNPGFSRQPATTSGGGTESTCQRARRHPPCHRASGRLAITLA